MSAELAVEHERGFSLFPGEKGPIPVKKEVDEKEIDECTTWQNEVDGFYELCFAGVVTYRFATSDRQHTTKFAFYIGELEEEQRRIVIPRGKQLYPNKLVFAKEYAASYAD